MFSYRAMKIRNNKKVKE
jgi:hypothetical protein